MERVARIDALRKQAVAAPVRNYELQTLEGNVSLLDLFAGRETLFAIHNMGQGCRYCTLWADGFNGFVPHLGSRFAVALLSKDPPQAQREFAQSRGWRFRMASHGGGEYVLEQSVAPGQADVPGLVCYERRGAEIFKRNATGFDFGDGLCSFWHFLSLARLGRPDWTPQYAYRKRPQKMDDGGLNILD